MVDDKLIKALGALSRPLTKLVEVVQNGIGAIGRPFLVIINAHARGRARLIREGYAHKLRKLKAANNAELAALSSAPLELLGSSVVIPMLPESQTEEALSIDVVFDDAEVADTLIIRAAHTEQDVKRRANVETIAAEAADHMPEDVSDHPVDEDWIARFFSHAQDVSGEEMQRLWGKILAGEVQTPGRFSVRTLDVLRNLSRTEAAAFAQIAPFMEEPDNCIIFGSHCWPLLPRDLGRAVDAGLLRPQRMWQAGHGERVLTYPGYRLHVRLGGPGFMDAYDVTSAGMELLSILERRPNREFVDALKLDLEHARYTVTVEQVAG